MSRRVPAHRSATVPASGFAWVTGRWTRWLVILFWFAAAAATIGFDLPAKLSGAETNERRSFLPADAESTRAANQLDAINPTKDVPLVAVVRRDSGLTAQDRAAIAARLHAFNRTPPTRRLAVRDADVKRGAPLPRVTLRDAVRRDHRWLTPGAVSKDGTSLLILGAVKITGDSDRLIDATDALRAGLLPLRERGLTMKVTGGAGFSYDAVKVFGDLNANLFVTALALVVVLLLLIYRSPVLLFLPLIAVIVAELTARGVAYLTTHVGVTVTGQSSAIMSVLVLGAGTDYALLVTSRYREELRHHDNRLDALRLAMASAGPAVFASGLTVVAGLITLLVASVRGTAGLGPIGAIGVAVAMLSMLTLLPAIFAVLPRGVFWPLVPRVGTTGADATHGFWRRTGERVAAAPRRTWIVTGLLLLVGVGGLTQFNPNLSENDTFVGDVESVDGGKLLAKSFPSGTSAPAQVIVTDRGKVQAVDAALRRLPQVAGTQLVAETQSGALIAATLNRDPYSLEAQDEIPAIREAVHRVAGDAVLVGGDTAINADLSKANGRDLVLIVPIVLAVVFLILIGLLRALVLPLVLIATVVLSFAAALGISSVVWTQLFGFAGADRAIILYAFVFLVALGIDYNIFLASRIREESLRHGTREGVLRGIGATGGVITAAGIVLAGTFVVLAVTPVVFLIETGSAIAIGVLLDTFVVRSILAPAIALDLGHRVWWPWGRHVPQDGEADAPTVSPGLSPNS